MVILDKNIIRLEPCTLFKKVSSNATGTFTYILQPGAGKALLLEYWNTTSSGAATTNLTWDSLERLRIYTDSGGVTMPLNLQMPENTLLQWVVSANTGNVASNMIYRVIGV